MIFRCNSKITDRKCLVVLFFILSVLCLPIYSYAYTKVYSTSDNENREHGVIYEVSYDNEMYSAENKKDEQKESVQELKHERIIYRPIYYNPYIPPYYNNRIIYNSYYAGANAYYPMNGLYYESSGKKYYTTLTRIPPRSSEQNPNLPPPKSIAPVPVQSKTNIQIKF